VELAGRAAIVTGAASGVGRATALALARRGCAVLVNYSRSREAAEQTAREAQALGVRAFAHRCDVADDAACRAMVEAALAGLGRLDVLVNNAGTTVFIPHDQLERVALEDWERIFAVNLRGPFQCARAARRALAAQGGAIVNVSSVAGIAGTGSSIPYCASKAALNLLTVSLARVLAADGIRVNAVAPGFIEGSWLREGLGAAYQPIKEAVEARAALGRVCRPEDVADAILSLLGGSDLVTGHVFPVDAGLLIGRS
jgi:3-oxoacyl-[acyl-carrier protein] reductase